MIQREWAGWRSEYVARADADDDGLAGTLFENILNSGKPDAETYIVHRGPTCFVILNAYPYNTAHCLVLPNRAVARLDELTADESGELWALVQLTVSVVEGVYSPNGINVGLNMGRAAGAGVPDHLHMHVLPRWNADTNFITTLAEAKVLPEALDRTWQRLTEAWPS